MKKTVIILLLAFANAANAQLPVNKDASPEAKKLLNYIYSIKGKKIISGQHTDIHRSDRHLDSVKSLTAGKRPALWGNDFIWSGTKDNGEAISDAAIKRYQEGYIICLMWHQGRPSDNPPYGWKESVQGKLTEAEWNQLITPGTALNKSWLAQIDQVAVWLKKLRDAHVPVLWRPYHEMNGVWFWWGNRPGKNGVAKLWQMMYDRYTNYHKLNNLIWVWGANGPRDLPEDEAYAYKLFYPGSGYVDVLGADIYNSDYEQKDYEELLNLAKGKPIALTEVGELPKTVILKHQPEWVWFMVWSEWLWTHNTRQQVREIYDLPNTVNLGDVNYK